MPAFGFSPAILPSSPLQSLAVNRQQKDVPRVYSGAIRTNARIISSAARSTGPTSPAQNNTQSNEPCVAADWKKGLKEGAVIEFWASGKLQFGFLEDLHCTSVTAQVVIPSMPAAGSETASITKPHMQKVSHGEIVAVWPEFLSQPSSGTVQQLQSDVVAGMRLLRSSLPRASVFTRLYDNVRRYKKSDSRSTILASSAAPLLFPQFRAEERTTGAAITVATALLLAADSERFKRAASGEGWRGLAPSVAASREVLGFVEVCTAALERRTGKSPESNGQVQNPVTWTRAQLEILRELEVCGASGSAVTGQAAAALKSLGYDTTDDGATKLLLDIKHWATGSSNPSISNAKVYGSAKHRLEFIPLQVSKKAKSSSERARELAGLPPLREKVTSDTLPLTITDTCDSNSETGTGGVDEEASTRSREWTFSPVVLAQARDIREESRKRRYGLLQGHISPQKGRRNFLRLPHDEKHRVYCVDDKTTKFLDDAISVKLLNGGSTARIFVHTADVDEIIRSGSAIDELARERGQSLYLPLKPLHMLPAAAMEAASFSTSLPSEAVTISIDFSYSKNAVTSWAIYPSVIPQVIRLNYEQLDLILAGVDGRESLPEQSIKDLEIISSLAPRLSELFDNRKTKSRKGRYSNGSLPSDVISAPWRSGHGDLSANIDPSIATLRLRKRSGNDSSESALEIAQLTTYQDSGAYAVIAGLLMAAGSITREYASQQNVPLPEPRAAASYSMRCGTAPLRRYFDLATQRQVKSALLGRKPASRKRMGELRGWLAKRQSAAEKAVLGHRKKALFFSFSEYCDRQAKAARSSFAVVRGTVRNTTVSRRGVGKVAVKLTGTRLNAEAEISRRVLQRADTPIGISYNNGNESLSSNESFSSTTKRTRSLEEIKSIHAAIRKVLPVGAEVYVQIKRVDTIAQFISAVVIGVVS